MSGLEDIFGLPSQPRQQVSGAQEGTITRHAPDGGVFFKIPTYSPTLEFGPAKWVRSQVEPASHGDGTHDHTETLPPVGAVCLVIFVGPGVQRPWVVGWW